MEKKAQIKKPSVSLWENEGGHIFEPQNNKEELDMLPEKLWGQQTKNSLKYFNIGKEQFDSEFIGALLSIKMAMLEANNRFKLLDSDHYEVIKRALELLQKESNINYYPVKIWQTGSGTQVNMNVNEVISSVANELSKRLGKNYVIHPNDHINMSQSSNDVIPSAMNISALSVTQKNLIPALELLEMELEKKEKEFNQILKIGRTHMMDAVPMTLGQEFSAFVYQIREIKGEILHSIEKLNFLPLGGTAVGTGMNCPSEVSDFAIEKLKEVYKYNFKKMPNLFSGVSTNNPMVGLSGQLRNLATILTKLTTDIILLSSGPHAGLYEITLPANEAGSSIMPRKINPTQCEALAMVCCQVIGNDLAISTGALQGKLQLSTFRPMIIRNIMHSLHILSDSIESFSLYCLRGIKPNLKVLEKNVERSKMIITYLAPKIGYEQAASIVNKSEERGSSIKQEILESGLMTEEEISKLMSKEFLTTPPSSAVFLS